MSLRVLILVLSCRLPPYDKLYEAQRRTWDAVEVEGVETKYYWCDSFEENPRALKKAIDEVWNRSWDFVFRTNSSSYVDKKALLVRSGDLPREKCYSGVDGGGFVSGSGILLSRDAVGVLRDALEDRVYEAVEDVVFGDLLRKAGVPITSGSRYDYWQEVFLKQFYNDGRDREVDILRAYHCRCKGRDEGRDEDVVAFEEIHRIKMTRAA